MKRGFLLFCPLVWVFAIHVVFSVQAAFADDAQRDGDGYQQVMLPKDVFVGDKAQLRYTFNNPIDFFALASPEDIDGDSLSLDPEYPVFVPTDESYSVYSVRLMRSGTTYTLEVLFVPWKPGVIDFAPFDLNEYCRREDFFETEMGNYAAENLVGFIVDLQPVTISSIAQRMGSLSIRPPASPILLPGTSYILWTVVISAVLLLAVLGVLLLRFRSVAGWFAMVHQKIIYLLHVRATKKVLLRLLKSDCGDTEFAHGWQNSVRQYLSYRFGRSFDSVPASRVALVISRATGNMMSDEQEDAVFDIASMFVRTDYIIFAHGSIDSMQLPETEHRAAFAEGERQSLVDRTFKSIAVLESNGELKNDGV